MAGASPSGALTERQRRSAFRAAAVVILGAAVAIGALGGHAHAPAPTPPAGRPARVVSVPGATTTASPSHHGARSRPPTQQPEAVDRDVVGATARTFLAAYLAYEVGPLDKNMREALLQSATPSLAQRLLSHPVDLPPRDRPATGAIQSLQVDAPSGAPPIRVQATIEQAGWVSSLTLNVEPRGGAWRVSSVS